MLLVYSWFFFYHFFLGLELSDISSTNSINSGYLVDATPPTVVWTDLLGTLQVFFFMASRYVSAFGIYSWSFFFCLFCLSLLSRFWISHFSSSNRIDSGYLVDATAYSCGRFVLKLCRCFNHDLKICMCFWNIPESFGHFWVLNFVIFRAQIV